MKSLRALVAEHEVALVVALPALGADEVLGVARELDRLDVAHVGDADDVRVGIGTRGRFPRHGAPRSWRPRAPSPADLAAT